MNPRFPSSALFWANFPESVLLTLGSHRSHKVAGASEDYDKKSGIPLTPPRSPWHPPDTRPKSNPWYPWDGDPWMLDQSPPNPPTTQRSPSTICSPTWSVSWENLCCQGSLGRSRSRAAATGPSKRYFESRLGVVQMYINYMMAHQVLGPILCTFLQIYIIKRSPNAGPMARQTSSTTAGRSGFWAHSLKFQDEVWEPVPRRPGFRTPQHRLPGWLPLFSTAWKV